MRNGKTPVKTQKSHGNPVGRGKRDNIQYYRITISGIGKGEMKEAAASGAIAGVAVKLAKVFLSPHLLNYKNVFVKKIYF